MVEITNEEVIDEEVNDTEKEMDDISEDKTTGEVKDNTESIERVVDKIFDNLKKEYEEIKEKNKETKKPKKFKIGLFGYLTIAVVARSIVGIVGHICNRKK